METRAALLIDFDNVLGGLLRLDPGAALRFAEDPGGWADRLAERWVGDRGRRRFLVRRCYMNPGGWVPNPDKLGNAKLFFSMFRSNFVRAGFEVVDCPRLSGTKNAADIRMVMDAMDALSAEVRYDQFVILSGDSDLTPLLVRLRTHDRRTILISPFDASEALTNVADQFVSGDQFLDLMEDAATADDGDGEEVEAHTLVPAHEPRAAGESAVNAADQAAAWVRRAYVDSEGPLVLSRLGHELIQEFGATARLWFGHGSLKEWLRSLELPHVEMNQHKMWDASRFAAPDALVLPPAVDQVSRMLKIPRAPREVWPVICVALANYAATHEYTMTEATRISTQQAQLDEARVSRSQVLFAIRAATYGGAPLYADPSPTAADVAGAVASNILDRTAATDLELSTEEAEEVRQWFMGAVDVALGR